MNLKFKLGVYMVSYDNWKCTDDTWVDWYEDEIDEEYAARVAAENACECDMPGLCTLCSRDERYYKYCYETKQLIKVS